MQMHTRVRIGRGSRWCFGAERIRLFVCLFVYHHLSSAVTPPVPPPRFRAPLAATVLTPTAHHSCARSLAPHLHVLAGATGEEGFATLHRIFYEFTRARVFVNRENEATGGVVWIFSSLAFSLLMPLSAQGNTDPGS